MEYIDITTTAQRGTFKVRKVILPLLGIRKSHYIFTQLR